MIASAAAITGYTFSKLFLGAYGSTAPGSTVPSAKSGHVDKGAALNSVSHPDNGVSVDLSASHDVFDVVDKFFNLNGSGQFESLNSLTPEEKGQAIKMITDLAKTGYVGYEVLLVDNYKVERHDVVMEIGDERLRKARVYHGPRER